ncbi:MULTISPECIES: cell wall-active antibiotics response protein LiaF [Neobacillus]|uniref:Cell wall-active antibiotics response protein n=1 Tax=Neobacillus rhizophilus TaxID=2833579 RepID=A0A942YU50_9BACI|nr:MULTISPECIES: cell wall-active antibiotics response protein LiaF [Neobacillus]MBS4213628.1 cell wall-active antibiotics response protein [Neobacillus rhizophilus]
MFKNVKNDYLGWLMLVGVVILLLEILFFNSGLIFSLFIAGGMVYLGRKRSGKKLGKLLFIGGIFFFVISVLNMMTFKFFLLAILLHFFIQFITSKKNPNKIDLQIIETENTEKEETLIQTKPLFENIFLGQQKTPVGVYEWNDINIQAGIGDTIIDLSYTMLPKGETVIFIRNLIGNVQILVPYEVDVSVQHSCLVGSSVVLEHHERKMFNQVFQLKTPGYEEAEHKVKIFTSLIVGNLEVTRI